MKVLALLLCFYSVLSYSHGALSDGAAIRTLMPGQSYVESEIIPLMQYCEDTTFDLIPGADFNNSIPLFDICPDNSWQRLPQNYIDFGFTPSKVWLVTELKNPSQNLGEWVLSLNTRFMNDLQAYVVRRGGVELIIEDNEFRNFSDREIAYRKLAAKFTLAAGERAQLVIGYWSRGTTALPLSIETERHFYQRWISENIWVVAFYASMLFMIGFSLCQYLIMRNTVQLAYMGVVGASILYVLHMDGLSFKLLWPNSPAWNAAASLYLGLTLNIFAAIFARTFLNTSKNHPRIDKVLIGAIGFTVLVLCSSLFLDNRWLKQYAFLIVTAGMLICMLSGIVAYFNGQKYARFYVLGWGGIFFAAGLASVIHWVSSFFPVPMSFNAAKVGMFIDAFMFTMAIADQNNDVRNQRDAANEREKALLARQLATQKEITLLADRYHKVRTLAEEKSHLLASAGHDLRQPIAALRLAAHNLYKGSKNDASVVRQFSQSFDYIEKMIKQYLERPDLAEASNYGTNASSDSKSIKSSVDCPQSQCGTVVESETFPVQILLQNVFLMFEAEANKKALQLRCVNSSAVVKANPLAAMRILANLVENAIKYTTAGKVVIGCRRRNYYVDVYVIDSGPGFSEDLDEICASYRRGENTNETEGLGLGLSIVAKLAQEHGYTFSLRSTSSKGSAIYFSLPVDKQARD